MGFDISISSIHDRKVQSVSRRFSLGEEVYARNVPWVAKEKKDEKKKTRMVGVFCFKIAMFCRCFFYLLLLQVNYFVYLCITNRLYR